MDAKLEQLEATLNSINFLNVGKKGQEAISQLAELLPQVESFQAEMQRLKDAIAHEQQDKKFQKEINDALRRELNQERSHSFDQRMKISELERRYKRMERLLDKIPREELEKFLPRQREYQR